MLYHHHLNIDMHNIHIVENWLNCKNVSHSFKRCMTINFLLRDMVAMEMLEVEVKSPAT